MTPYAEISIPTTCLSSPTSGKPFTLYNITLRLPLRSYVVQKRYSNFLTLHQALTHHIGSAPPAPLPAKSWIRRTVNDPTLTENRRAALETYLRAIAETPDRRWRDTATWRAFLNLPPPGASSSISAASNNRVSVSAAVGGTNGTSGGAATAAVAAADPTTWLDLHRDLKGALHEARMGLAKRDAASDNAGRAAAGAAAQRGLVRAGTLITALSEGLRAVQQAESEGGTAAAAPRRPRLGVGEIRRRKDLIAAARVERDGLEKLSMSMALSTAAWESSATGPTAASSSAAAAAAPSGPRAGGRVLGVPLPETDRTRELDNQGVLRLQRQTMEDQDQDVQVLAQVVRRQREMGLAIKEEVDRQTEMLDRMNEDADRVESKVRVAKERTRRLGRS